MPTSHYELATDSVCHSVFFLNLLWLHHNFNYSLFFCDFFRNKTDLWEVSYFELAEHSVCNFLCKTYFGSNIYFNYSLFSCDFFRNKTDLWEVLNFNILEKLGSICIDGMNAKCGERSSWRNSFWYWQYSIGNNVGIKQSNAERVTFWKHFKRSVEKLLKLRGKRKLHFILNRATTFFQNQNEGSTLKIYFSITLSVKVSNLLLRKNSVVLYIEQHQLFAELKFWKLLSSFDNFGRKTLF